MGDFTAAAKKLEFDKVVKRLTQLAQTDPGKQAASLLFPSNDRSAIQHALILVGQMKELLIAEGTIPLDGLKNILPVLKKTSIENQVLTTQEFLDVAAALRVSRSMKQFLSRRKTSYPELCEVLPKLCSDKVLEYNILEAIDESGHVRDSASKELRLVRKDMADLTEQLRKSLSTILRSVAEQEFLQDEIITTRDGRLVIPVKVEFKNRVPGFMHSSSASGATVFIEPAETLDLNNALRELQFREVREIERILKTLTGIVKEVAGSLEDSVRVLGQLDFIAAKAKYSIEILGNAPRLVQGHSIRLIDARHPLLLSTHKRESVVPLDLSLGGDITVLVITGPNAGGKSVALKTVGLCALCAQSGLHIPAHEDSEVAIFDSLFVDMGDDQSIENDLSTFSSHLMNLRDILNHAGETSLVLIDEIGTGTDPEEGGALASAVLQDLVSRKALTITTTHHGTLKAFAHQTRGIANGSMEFDQASLQPTYRFRFGVPGSSYALELADRMGLHKELLSEARAFLGSEKIKLEGLIISLERDIQEYSRRSASVAADRKQLDALLHEYEKRLSDVRKEIREMKQKAQTEAQDLVRDAQSTIERVIREIREAGASKSSIQSAKSAVQDIHERASEQSVPEISASPDRFSPGDRVRLKEGTETGEVVEIRGKHAVVQWRSGTLLVECQDLQKTSVQRFAGDHHASFEYRPEAKSEVDLRGLTGEEAITKVQNVLDDAFVTGLHRVDIIHGKGTGALRKRIKHFLESYPHIKSFRLGEWNEGGSGVTVVELSE